MSVPSLARFKRCTKCGCTKPASREFFYRERRRWKAACKVCYNAAGRERYEADPGKRSQQSRKWHRENPEKVKASKKRTYLKYAARNRKRSREYYRENREACLERSRAWKEENAERAWEKVREYHEKNRERIAEKRRIWDQSNPEKKRAKDLRRRALKLKAEHVPYTAEDLIAMWHEQGGCCHYCGTPLFDLYHVEHMTPLFRGGADALANICLSCPFCNACKGTLTAEEFADKLRRAG